ncbi:MAG TPA: VOC family protein [Anaerolineales bacterium]|nr:VOC family protein [Anaerolineales bacterium]
MTNKAKLVNVCPVFISDDVKATTEYYVDVLGFKYARHFDKADQFATLYRDEIEIVVVQKLKGSVESNTQRYGNGFDAYIDPETLEGVDILFREFQEKNVKIIANPHITDYGSYEFVFEDIDGRIIGVGLIANKNRYFENSNFLEKNG